MVACLLSFQSKGKSKLFEDGKVTLFGYWFNLSRQLLGIFSWSTAEDKNGKWGLKRKVLYVRLKIQDHLFWPIEDQFLKPW